MLYTAINVALIVALAATSAFAFVMYREFRRFRLHSTEYAAALQETARAMDGVERAVEHVHGDGAKTLIALGERIDAAHRTLSSLEAAGAAATAQLMRLESRIEEASRLRAQAEGALTRRGTAEPQARPAAEDPIDDAVVWPILGVARRAARPA